MNIRDRFTKSIKYALAHDYVPMKGYKTLKCRADVNKGGFGYVAFLIMSETETDEYDKPKKFEVTFSVADILFDHGFAKAIWGEEAFKHHLQQMALLEANWERLVYLGNNT